MKKETKGERTQRLHTEYTLLYWKIKSALRIAKKKRGTKLSDNDIIKVIDEVQTIKELFKTVSRLQGVKEMNKILGVVLIFILLGCQPKVVAPDDYTFVGKVKLSGYMLKLDNGLTIENPNKEFPSRGDSIYSDKYGQNYIVVPK